MIEPCNERYDEPTECAGGLHIHRIPQRSEPSERWERKDGAGDCSLQTPAESSMSVLEPEVESLVISEKDREPVWRRQILEVEHEQIVRTSREVDVCKDLRRMFVVVDIR